MTSFLSRFSLLKILCINVWLSKSSFILVGFIISGSRFSAARVPKHWCDPVLGCLNLTDAWYTTTRPINVLPLSRAKINTRFYLHTRQAPNIETNYIVAADNLTSLTKSPFDPIKPTKFIVHGFLDNGNTKWLKDLAASLLNYGDYNVFRVDWGHGSLRLYSQATANIRIVGLEIGYLVNTLSKSSLKLNPAIVHCIGHSLGSHVCGYAGEQISTMGRITGLDPAGPYFKGTPDFIHLDPTDATFVDNIHTDIDSFFVLGWGITEPYGNLDFYPNSGYGQPGCDPSGIAIGMITNDITDATRDVFACSHIRAINFFQDSLNSPHCNWLAHECDDYRTFKAGMCASCSADNTKCAFMGIRADEYVLKTRNLAVFYLDTAKNHPHCIQHYQVSILTSALKAAKAWVVGKLFITLHGDKSDVISEVIITKDHEPINHGKVKTALFTSHKDVGHVLKVELKWVSSPVQFCLSLICLNALFVQSIQVSGISHYPETERIAHTSLACAVDGNYTKIMSGKTASFNISSSCVPVTGR